MLFTTGTSWFFLLQTLIEAERRFNIAYVGLALLAPLGALVGLYGGWKQRNFLAATGFLVGAASPTFFFYLGNLALLAVAAYEFLIALRRRPRTAT